MTQPKVLITRPMPESLRLARRLEDLGYCGIIAPLLTIKPLPMSALDNITTTTFDAVMLTSRNALLADVLSHESTARLRTLPCFCVGDETAGVARQNGFTNVHASEGNGSALAEYVAITLPRPSHILYLAGEYSKPEAASILHHYGYAITTVTVYTAIPVASLPTETRTLLVERQIAAAMFFSPRTLQVFHGLLRSHGLIEAVHNMQALVISNDVAEVAVDLPWGKIAIANGYSEEAMIVCLRCCS